MDVHRRNLRRLLSLGGVALVLLLVVALWVNLWYIILLALAGAVIDGIFWYRRTFPWPR
jgi:Flp pilus assembly protein TadB